MPAAVLNPRRTWPDAGLYDGKARELARLFVANFEAYSDPAAPEVMAAAPRP